MHRRERPRPRPWLAAVDESCVSGERFLAFGSLWLPYDRRGDLAALFAKLSASTGAVGELKWNKIKRGGRLKMASKLIDAFFGTSWLAFHAYLLERSVIALDHHAGDLDLARRKHLTQFLSHKMKRVVRKHGLGCRFYVWIDPIASRYAKADEALETVSRHIVGKMSGFGRRGEQVVRVRTHDSRTQPAIQFCDVLLGAVASSYNGKLAKGGAKAEVASRICGHLGWTDLVADTLPTEPKFNVWNFHDPIKSGQRRVPTRRCPSVAGSSARS